MTYNIRLDTQEDGINQWIHRKKGLVSLIRKLNPDILGIQEGLPNQILYLSKQLEGYSLIGNGREGENITLNLSTILLKACATNDIASLFEFFIGDKNSSFKYIESYCWLTFPYNTYDEKSNSFKLV